MYCNGPGQTSMFSYAKTVIIGLPSSYAKKEDDEDTITDNTCSSLGITCDGLPSSVTNVDKKNPMKMGEKRNCNTQAL